MCAYNRLNGEPCCGSTTLLTDILRRQWGFEGYVVSDCWALNDIQHHHKLTTSPAESAALAINSGVNLNCGVAFGSLVEAVHTGQVSEATIDASVAILLRTRFRLGQFDPPESNPYATIAPDVVDCEKHRTLAREAAVKSIVLLKNRRSVLPLQEDIAKLFVVGPQAASTDALWGNYHGLGSRMVTILEGIVGRVGPSSSVQYRQGCLMDRPNADALGWSVDGADGADAVVAVMGVTSLLEGERGDAIASPHQGDRLDPRLPAHQVEYLKALRAATDKPLVVILTGGSPLIVPEVHELADAILFVWYPGAEGGNAVADVLFGDARPSGRLPLTFPRSVEHVPPYENYRMAGRTYRYAKEPPLYPFGYGLSYTRFGYSDPQVSPRTVRPGDGVTIRARVTNEGEVAGEEVVQAYLRDVEASVDTPRWSLVGVRRIGLGPGGSKTVTFTVTPGMMTLVDRAGVRKFEPGEFRITIGGASPGRRAQDLGAPTPVTAVFELTD
jgi:beta-glucosidase